MRQYFTMLKRLIHQYLFLDVEREGENSSFLLPAELAKTLMEQKPVLFEEGLKRVKRKQKFFHFH